MLGDLPPYALRASVFRFPALAALAGRRPLGGGEREVALAALVCAHLVVGALPESALSADARSRRASGARAWLAAMALPATARTPLARLIDASGHGDPAIIRSALRAALDAIARSLDAASKRELDRLGASLAAAANP